MKLFESTDRLQHILSLLVLFVHHGLRDNLITGISSVLIKIDNDNSSTKEIQNIGLLLEKNLYKDSQDKQDWTYASIGGILSAIHWGVFLPLILSPLVIPRIPRKYLLSGSLISSGIVALFSELSSKNGFVGLFILRFLQGLLQGWCYPIVFYSLEDSQSLIFVVPYFFIFLAPWLGSAIGTLLGWTNNPFTGNYVFGPLSIILGGFIFLTSNVKGSTEKPEKPWVECLTSAALWSCVGLCVATTWALHTFIVGLSYTLKFRFENDDLMWMVSVVILVGGIVTRLIAMTAMHLLRNKFLSPKNRRRAIIVTGTLIAITSLILNGVTGLDSEYALFGVSILGVGGGVGLLLVGVRLNLHDLGPLFPTPFLLLGSMGSTLGAALASLLFPILAQTDSTEDAEDDGPWKLAWMIAIIPLALACCIHFFLVSVIPLPHQTIVNRTSVPVINVNGTPDVMEEMDAKSFKSLKSAVSFKTAVSRNRSRTVSFQTVADSVEFDLHSLPDSKSDGDCVSVIQDDDDAVDNAEMKSVKSGVTSFKSASNSRANSVDGARIGVVLNANELDRTTAWLSTHHDKNAPVASQTSVAKETVERNILIALQW